MSCTPLRAQWEAAAVPPPASQEHTRSMLQTQNFTARRYNINRRESVISKTRVLFQVHVCNENVFHNNFCEDCKSILDYKVVWCNYVCSHRGVCVSSACRIWVHSSWMSWWAVCYHAGVHLRHYVPRGDRPPGGPHICLHTPFTTIRMVRMYYVVINGSTILEIRQLWLIILS